MPTYRFKKPDGEIISVDMKISELDEYRKNHPDYISQLSAPMLGGSRSVTDNTSKLPDGFKDRLKEIKKSSGGNGVDHLI